MPLAVLSTPANKNEVTVLLALLDEEPPALQPDGSREDRPGKLHLDNAYRGKDLEEALRERGVEPRIARRGIERSDRLGRYRWVAERAIAWIRNDRRMVVRYERRQDVFLGLLKLACVLATYAFVKRLC